MTTVINAASRSSASTFKVWTDESTGVRAFAVTSFGGLVVYSALGIWLSLSAKYFKAIIANSLHGVFVWRHARKLSAVEGDEPTENSRLLNHTVEPEQHAHTFGRILKDPGGIRDVYWEVFRKLVPGFERKDPKKSLTWGNWWLLVVFAILFTVPGIGIIVGGIELVHLKEVSPALLASKQAGLWIFPPNWGSRDAQTRAAVRKLEKEVRAGDYATTCYSNEGDAALCDSLYRRRLRTTKDRPLECPFKPEICHDSVRPVVFETGNIDAGDIGINHKKAPKFRRKTTCTLLSMNEPYITKTTDNDGTYHYYYNYGRKPLHRPPVDWTYNTTGDPFERTSPVYEVGVYVYDNYGNSTPAWIPREELTVPPNSTLTLMFVTPLRILYRKSSEDPLFPAKEPYYLYGSNEVWFRNGDPRARPLACLTSIEACLHDGKTCWPMNVDVPYDEVSAKHPEFWLMYTSLLYTDIADAIERRLGRALLAQGMVSQYFSEPIEDEHWIKEVYHMENTSLARTQINAWSIATAEDSPFSDTYILTPPANLTGDMRGLFKFNPTGYVSFRLWPFISVCLVPLAVWILSWKVPKSWANALRETSEDTGSRDPSPDATSNAQTGTHEQRSARSPTPSLRSPASSGPEEGDLGLTRPIQSTILGPREERDMRDMRGSEVGPPSLQEESSAPTAPTSSSTPGPQNSPGADAVCAAQAGSGTGNADEDDGPMGWEPVLFNYLVLLLYRILTGIPAAVRWCYRNVSKIWRSQGVRRKITYIPLLLWALVLRISAAVGWIVRSVWRILRSGYYRTTACCRR